MKSPNAYVMLIPPQKRKTTNQIFGKIGNNCLRSKNPVLLQLHCTAVTLTPSSTTVRRAATSTAKSLGFSIKKEQLETIENFVCGRHVFSVLPTGFVLSVSSWNIQQTLFSEQ